MFIILQDVYIESPHHSFLCCLHSPGDASASGDRAPVRRSADAAPPRLPQLAGPRRDVRAALGGRLEAERLPRALQCLQGWRSGKMILRLY